MVTIKIINKSNPNYLLYKYNTYLRYILKILYKVINFFFNEKDHINLIFYFNFILL